MKPSTRDAAVPRPEFGTAAPLQTKPVLLGNGVPLQILEPAVLQGHGMGGAQYDTGRPSGSERLLPARGAEAPTVAGLQAGKAVVRPRCAEIVATGTAELEELGRHFGTHRVAAEILGSGFAAAGAGETGARV